MVPLRSVGCRRAILTSVPTASALRIRPADSLFGENWQVLEDLAEDQLVSTGRTEPRFLTASPERGCDYAATAFLVLSRMVRSAFGVLDSGRPVADSERCPFGKKRPGTGSHTFYQERAMNRFRAGVSRTS